MQEHPWGCPSLLSNTIHDHPGAIRHPLCEHRGWRRDRGVRPKWHLLDCGRNGLGLRPAIVCGRHGRIRAAPHACRDRETQSSCLLLVCGL
jgi:hypothetical protein